jgi:hypothetical protein
MSTKKVNQFKPKNQKKTKISFILATLMFTSSAHSATQIQWWHAMGGELGEKINEIAQNFNQSQSDYIIEPIYKGSYPETMTGAIAAFRSKQHPVLVQVFEVGTATMMSAKKAIYPISELMHNTNEPFVPSSYLPAVTGYYSDTNGNMISMPFNSSTPGKLMRWEKLKWNQGQIFSVARDDENHLWAFSTIIPPISTLFHKVIEVLFGGCLGISYFYSKCICRGCIA